MTFDRDQHIMNVAYEYPEEFMFGVDRARVDLAFEAMNHSVMLCDLDDKRKLQITFDVTKGALDDALIFREMKPAHADAVRYGAESEANNVLYGAPKNEAKDYTIGEATA